MKVKSESEVAQSCLTLSDPMDCSLPGSSVHGIFQARVLEWGAVAFSIINASRMESLGPCQILLSPAGCEGECWGHPETVSMEGSPIPSPSLGQSKPSLTYSSLR